MAIIINKAADFVAFKDSVLFLKSLESNKSQENQKLSFEIKQKSVFSRLNQAIKFASNKYFVMQSLKLLKSLARTKTS